MAEALTNIAWGAVIVVGASTVIVVWYAFVAWVMRRTRWWSHFSCVWTGGSSGWRGGGTSLRATWKQDSGI